jgi:succinyldiaminopimelate transaminase
MTFTLPPYPYDRLAPIIAAANRHEGGAIECSIGTPCDPPPAVALEAFAKASTHRGYPMSFGSESYRSATASWMKRRFGVDLSLDQVAACVGTKEFVASLGQYLHLRTPERDTILYPAISYPTYAMSAQLANVRAVPVRMENGRLDLESIDPHDAARALVLWSNSPSNPTGHLDNLGAAAAWGRAHGVLVASDECYAEFTWASAPRSILQHGTEGVIAVHSISKRSNLAGVRAGFYAGDPEVVGFLRAVRQHAGLMVPGPVQEAVAAAYRDDAHVELQRTTYRRRLELVRAGLEAVGIKTPMPEGAFYLWGRGPEGDGFVTAQMLAERSGLVVSPGELYGEAGTPYIRVAVVQNDERLALAARRLLGN